MPEQLSLFLIFLKSSALAIGGLASLPLLRADLVPRYVTDAGIIQALAVGRLAPGPNGLYIVSLGYIVAGWAGALYALIGASLAPLAMLPATALARRWLLSRWFGGLVRGVSLATAGLLLATGVTIVGGSGTAVWQLALVVVTVVVTIHGKLHPATMIVVGGAVGIALGR
ncbi:MAG TPA: chromate transporter [Candidatus Limnocylindria bacterium]|nr:chromate transporter [Candidatus Limnocylindria bacterium]